MHVHLKKNIFLLQVFFQFHYNEIFEFWPLKSMIVVDPIYDRRIYNIGLKNILIDQWRV